MAEIRGAALAVCRMRCTLTTRRRAGQLAFAHPML
jgi:hypothetical protein